MAFIEISVTLLALCVIGLARKLDTYRKRLKDVELTNQTTWEYQEGIDERLKVVEKIANSRHPRL